MERWRPAFAERDHLDELIADSDSPTFP
jgi:hypothetical protein